MSEKITVTFSDGKRRVLKSPDEMENIDARRTALFVFNNFQVYRGTTDGEVDEDGDFCLKTDRSTIPGTLGIGLPFARLIGWAVDITVKRIKGRHGAKMVRVEIKASTREDLEAKRKAFNAMIEAQGYGPDANK